MNYIYNLNIFFKIHQRELDLEREMKRYNKKVKFTDEMLSNSQLDKLKYASSTSTIYKPFIIETRDVGTSIMEGDHIKDINDLLYSLNLANSTQNEKIVSKKLKL